MRTPNSRRREAFRATISIATLLHAISSTSVTSAISTSTGSRLLSPSP
jgi:hypothetical protein